MKGAGGNDKGPGCDTDAMIAAPEGASIPNTPAASEETAEVMGSWPRLRIMRLPQAAKTIAELATLENPTHSLT